jgi:uncharacterized membrane protein
MKVPPLLSGSRWVAVLVAAVLVTVAAVVFFRGYLVLSVSGAAFTAALGLISTGVTAFFWYADRHDRLLNEARQERARQADTRPVLEFQQEVLDAGGGYSRREIWLLNHGPGSASELVISVDGLTGADLGSTAQSRAAWSATEIVERARHLGPYPRAGLAAGVTNRVLVYRDSEAPSTGGAQLPLGPNDLSGFVLVGLSANCKDADGRDIGPCTGYVSRVGGYYRSYSTVSGWIDSWGLQA